MVFWRHAQTSQLLLIRMAVKCLVQWFLTVSLLLLRLVAVACALAIEIDQRKECIDHPVIFLSVIWAASVEAMIGCRVNHCYTDDL